MSQQAPSSSSSSSRIFLIGPNRARIAGRKAAPTKAFSNARRVHRLMSSGCELIRSTRHVNSSDRLRLCPAVDSMR